jgi:tetratricopeptide (TPR) repeat protein
VLFAISCSTKKDALLNRKWHALNTKFNVLYNGDIALQKGLDELNSKYKDDYWKRLPIEPLKVEELAIPGIEVNGDNSNASFEKAEEKAVKAVQKHSMNIKGREKNNQIDDAYLLLGKSRYYSQRFVPALEAFNYVLEKYPTADLIHETRIWKAKSQLRLNNEEQALRTMQYLLKKEDLIEEETLEKAHTAIAMVYTEMDSTDLVIHHLKRATITDNDKEQTARNLFVLGQLYRERGNIDSSQTVFQQVIEMKRIPYKYSIHSQIEKAKNLTDSTDTSALIETLNKLIKDRDNRPYLDELHYQTGLVHKKLGRIDVAEENFVKSVHTKQAKQFQQGLSYEELGNIHFDKAKFVDAGAYYDSVLSIPVANKNTKRLRRLKRKRENLEEVITFEGISHKTDSILNIVEMSKDEQTAFFQSHIDALKEAEEKAAQEVLNAGFGSFDDSRNQVNSSGKWYFYNTQVVGFGTQEFQRVWGNRPLEDNWRLSDKTVFRTDDEEEIEEVANDEIEASKKYDIASYLERIPTEEKVIDSIKSVRNDAYYNLGLIYKEQFRVQELATDRFEKLLTFSPDEKLVLPTKYHLYKAYLELNSPKASRYKNDITTNYADSKYAKLILNPQSVIAEANDENSPENIYKKVYYEYEAKKYDDVIAKANKAIVQYEDLPILPKFELLRAYAIGKKDGVEAFRTALEFVKLNYSNTEEGKKAAQVIDTIDY